MIDKVTLRIWKNNLTEQVFSHLSERLEGKKTTTDENGQIAYERGRLNGLSVTLSERGASISGSLTKYLSGSNFNTMRQHDLTESVIRLCSDIGVSAEVVRVSCIEIGDTFVMENEPLRYINQLAETGYVPRFYKSRIRGSLYYQQKARQREIIFYDKVAEMKYRREPIPAGLNNLLRYEVRLHYQALKRYLPTMTIADLMDGQVFKQLIEMWRGYFETLYNTARPIKRGRGRTEILLQYAYQLQKRYNVEASDLSNYLNETLKGTANATRLKQKVASFYAIQGQEDNGLLKELRDRVTESVL